jgi:hypothetical protein
LNKADAKEGPMKQFIDTWFNKFVFNAWQMSGVAKVALAGNASETPPMTIIAEVKKNRTGTFADAILTCREAIGKHQFFSDVMQEINAARLVATEGTQTVAALVKTMYIKVKKQNLFEWWCSDEAKTANAIRLNQNAMHQYQVALSKSKSRHCCVLCSTGKGVKNRTQTNQGCAVCGVYLCTPCMERWHSFNDLREAHSCAMGEEPRTPPRREAVADVHIRTPISHKKRPKRQRVASEAQPMVLTFPSVESQPAEAQQQGEILVMPPHAALISAERQPTATGSRTATVPAKRRGRPRKSEKQSEKK